MFRKPKRKIKNALRKKDGGDEDESSAVNYNPMARAMAHPENAEDEEETSELLQEACKRVKTVNTAAKAALVIQGKNRFLGLSAQYRLEILAGHACTGQGVTVSPSMLTRYIVGPSSIDSGGSVDSLATLLLCTVC